ncbi:MAG: Gfo/Idh/MocA family oxidoreductase [Verrucomicrobiota bacterium]
MKKIYSTTTRSTRRDFLKKSAIYGTFSILPSYLALGNKSGKLPASERVNVAFVGIANRGKTNLGGCKKTGLANCVALCDIDIHSEEAKEQTTKFPDAKTFTDWRKMFDEMGDEIDAVVISTPDHSHFSVTMQAMDLGKHVYCEKPLAHTFGQCERLIAKAEKTGVATQMGNQGHSGGNYFQFKLWSEKRIIKDVTKITAHMNSKRRWHSWKNISAYPEQSVKEGVDWDLWLDSAPEHPYSDKLHPGDWRSWYDYGSGAFGDWGPHILDTCHRFLELGYPTKIKAVKRDTTSSLIYPVASTIQFDFAPRNNMPACHVTWYDGQGNFPEVEEELGRLNSDGIRQPVNLSKPGKIIYGKATDGSDLVFQGGSHAKTLRIIPDEKLKELAATLPKIATKQSGHYKNFLLGCKGEEEPRSPFAVGGTLTQVFNLGILAQRFGGEIQFDPSTKQITNHPEANTLLDPEPRKGWEQYYKV